MWFFYTYLGHLLRLKIWVWYELQFFQNAASLFIGIWNVTAMWYKQGPFLQFIDNNMEMSDQRTVTGSAPNEMAIKDCVKFHSQSVYSFVRWFSYLAAVTYEYFDTRLLSNGQTTHKVLTLDPEAILTIVAQNAHVFIHMVLIKNSVKIKGLILVVSND